MGITQIFIVLTLALFLLASKPLRMVVRYLDRVANEFQQSLRIRLRNKKPRGISVYQSNENSSDI